MTRLWSVLIGMAATLFAHVNTATGSLPPDLPIAELIGVIEPPTDVPGQVFTFGWTLSVSGDRLFVGAPSSQDGQVETAGLGFVYDVRSLELLHTLQNPAVGTLNYFGASAVPLGDDLVVGGADGAGNDIAFRFDGATGSLLQTYTRTPSPDASGGFFTALAMSDDSVYVGVVDGGTNGKVFVFDAASGDLKSTILDPPPLGSNDVFGSSVVATPESIVVGAFRDGSSGPDTGSVFLFDSSDYKLQNRIGNPTPGQNDQFGRLLALVGGNLAVGAPVDGTAGPQSGAVYLFDPASGALLTTLLNPSPDPLDFFGVTLGTVGDHLLVSAHSDENVANGGGVVYQYDPLSGDLVSLLPSPISTGQAFGRALASFGNTVFVGDPVREGRVYVFRVVPEPESWALLIATIAIFVLIMRGQAGKRCS